MSEGVRATMRGIMVERIARHKWSLISGVTSAVHCLVIIGWPSVSIGEAYGIPIRTGPRSNSLVPSPNCTLLTIVKRGCSLIPSSHGAEGGRAISLISRLRWFPPYDPGR